MKFTNLGLLFSMILVCSFLILDNKTRSLTGIANAQLRYNSAVDNAIEAAMDRLVEVDYGKEKKLNKEEAVNVFFDSLAIQFDVINQKNLRERLKGYVPVIAVILDTGFYIYYDQENLVNGEKLVEKKFSGFYPFVYETGRWKYYFTLTDYIRIYDKESKDWEKGIYSDLVFLHPESILTEQKEFDRVRRNCIVNTLTQVISYYMTEHNKIAKHYGIRYHFSLPVIPREDWYRTIDDISMVALFQGYPYGNGTTGFYNRFAAAGARIHKKQIIR